MLGDIYTSVDILCDRPFYKNLLVLKILVLIVLGLSSE